MDFDIDFDIHKTLIELEPEAWDPAGIDPALFRLASKPVRKLGPAELHALLNANLCLTYVVPLTLELLRDDPFLEATEFPGDLLMAALEADNRFWIEEYDLWVVMIEILEGAITHIHDRIQREELPEYLPWHVSDEFIVAVQHFRNIHPD